MNRCTSFSTRRHLWATCLVLLSLAVSPVALAQRGGYVPPRTGSPPDARTIAGTRGGECNEATNTTLTALAPYGHVGQTALTHPTFAWYVPGSQPPPVEFRLYGYGADGYLQSQPLHEVTLDSSDGVMSYRLPSDQPGLAVGQSYYWQIAMLCDLAHPSEDLVAGTKIEVVAAGEQTSLWYDLLGQALQAANSDLTLSLLSELATIEETTGSELVETAVAPDATQPKVTERGQELIRQSQQLRQIVEVEQP
jgi:hypothetical protein